MDNTLKDNLKRYDDFRKNGGSCFLDADDLADIAEYYLNRGNAEEARFACDYALSIYPGATLPLALKARMAQFIDEDPEKAEELAEAIADKTDLDYYFIKAELMIANNKAEDADKYLEEKIDLLAYDDQDDYFLDTASMFIDYNLFTYAEKWLKRCHDKSTNDFKELWSSVLISHGRFKESEDIVNELIDSDPYSSPYWNKLASSQFLRDNFKDSLQSSEYSIAINPDDSEAILNKANSLFMLGNFQEALKFFKRFSELEPYNETGEMFEGLSLANMGKNKEAGEHFLKALDIVKKHNPSSLNLGEIYQQLAVVATTEGCYADALAYTDKAEENGADKVLCEINRTYALLSSGETDKAMVKLQKILAEHGYDSNVYLSVTVAVYDAGYLKLAYKLLHVMLDDKANGLNHRVGWSYLARCCFDLKKDDEYRQCLLKAVRLNPGEAQSVLADLYPEGVDPKDYPNYTPQLR